MRLRFQDWVRQVWLETEDIPLTTIRTVMRTAVSVLVRELFLGAKITIRGLGTFDIYRRPPRKFFNPRDKNFVEKGVTLVPRFKFSVRIKDKVFKMPPESLDGGTSKDA